MLHQIVILKLVNCRGRTFTIDESTRWCLITSFQIQECEVSCKDVTLQMADKARSLACLGESGAVWLIVILRLANYLDKTYKVDGASCLFSNLRDCDAPYG